MKKSSDKSTGRNMIRNATLLGVGGTMLPLNSNAQDRKSKAGKKTAESGIAAPKTGKIIEENNKPGTLEWQLQYTAFDDPITLASTPLVRATRSSVIEGFVSKTSLYPGESLDFKVSLSRPANFTIDIYRLGYYGGLGGRHMKNLGSFQGRPQPMPMMTIERLRECNWETATSLTIPDDWPSGVYLGKLSREEAFGKQSYVIFVVKERRASEILFEVSDLTWQAYNKWPGRDSLYDDGTTEVWFSGTNVRVSFDRPYAKYCQVLDAALSAGSGEFLLWEFPLAFWLEKEGYDVCYCSNLDLHLDPDILARSKVMTSIGHDEYWSRKMFEEVTKARDNGLSIAFFSGNSVCYDIHMFDSTISGDPCRAFSRKEGYKDENTLMGNSTYGGGYGDWVIKNSSHWIYEGTGLKDGDKITAMIGWEYHGPPLGDIPGLVEVAGSKVSGEPRPGRPEKLHAGVVYPCPKGNWVFNAGTIWWADGLSQPPGHIPSGIDGNMRTFGVRPVVQKITTNILNRMIKDSPVKI